MSGSLEERAIASPGAKCTREEVAMLETGL